MRWSHEALRPQWKPVSPGGEFHDATGHGPVVPRRGGERLGCRARAGVEGTLCLGLHSTRNDGAMPRRGSTRRPEPRPAKESP